MASAEFLRAMASLQTRVGGAVAPSTTDLAQTDDDDSALEEMRHEMFKGLDGSDLRPPTILATESDLLHPLAQEHSEVQMLLTELAGLREEVNALRAEINELKQGTMI